MARTKRICPAGEVLNVLNRAVAWLTQGAAGTGWITVGYTERHEMDMFLTLVDSPRDRIGQPRAKARVSAKSNTHDLTSCRFATQPNMSVGPPWVFFQVCRFLIIGSNVFSSFRMTATMHERN